MHTQLHQRLQELKAEYEAGQKMFAELEAKHASLRDTLLRISGAIQVLEEVLAAPSTPTGQAAGTGSGAEAGALETQAPLGRPTS